MKTEYRAVTLDLEDRHWWYRGRRRVLREVLASLPLPPSPRCLDAGCGGGGNLPELARLGPTTGLEPDAEALARARARGAGEVLQGRIEEMPFADASFELATALDVIEHLDDDRAGLRELRRVVVDGGFLVVSVPAYPRLWGPHDVANDHRRRYRKASLLEAAVSAGWRPALVTHFNLTLLGPAVARRLVQRERSRRDAETLSDFERTPRWADRALERVLAVEARAIRAGRRLPAGLSLIASFEATEPTAPHPS